MRIVSVLVGLLFVASAFASDDEKPWEKPDWEESDQEEMGEPRDLDAIRFPQKYEVGRTYYYKLYSQILTGTPQSSDQYTGYRLAATVRLAIRKGKKVFMTLKNLDLRQTSRVLPVDRPTVLLPASLFESLSSQKLWQRMKAKLSLPMMFTWTETGWVRWLRFHKKDEFWSMNLKKSAASILNVNMRFETKDVFSSNGVYQVTPYYEDGIDGQCKSKWSYKRFPYTLRSSGNRNHNLMTVIKSRDLLDCKKKPWMTHALLLKKDCEEERPAVMEQTETRYNLTKIRKNYFLRQMKTISQYSYIPDSQRNGSITTYTVQRMFFIRDKAGAEISLRENEAAKKPQGLMMMMPIQEMNPRKPESKKLRRQAKTTLILMGTSYIKDKVEMYDRMREFIETSRKMSAKDLRWVFDSKLEGESEETKLRSREMMLEIFPKIATKEAIKVITDIINEEKLTDDVTSMLVSRLSDMSFVSNDRMITMLMKSAKKIKTNARKETYKSLLLTIGRLINTRFNLPVPPSIYNPPKIITNKMIRIFYENILNNPSTILSEDMKMITTLYSVGNCDKVDPCLDILEKWIPNPKKLKPAVRTHAVWALSSLAARAPVRVRRLVMPIYFDDREDVQLRLTAYMVFMKSKPKQCDVKIITKSLANEPIKQVRSYVVSHLQMLSKVSEKCDIGLSWNVSRVLNEVPKEIAGAQYSRIVDIPLPIRWNKMLLLEHIATPKSFLPRSLDLIGLTRSMGMNIDLLQLTTSFKERQDLLQKLLGPGGTMRYANSIKKLLRVVGPSETLDSSFLSVIKMYQSVYAINGLRSEATRLLKKGLIPVSQSIYDLLTKGGIRRNKVAATVYVDKISNYPTTFGVPFSVNHTITGHLKVHYQLALKPNIFSKVGVIDLKVKRRGSVRSQLRGGVSLSLLKSYVIANLQVHVPKGPFRTIKIGWDTRDKTKGRVLRVNVEKPKSSLKILAFGNRIHTALSQDTSLIPIEKTWPIIHRSLPYPKRKTQDLVSTPYLGFKITAQTLRLNSTGLADMVRLPFYGPCDIKVYYQRTSPAKPNAGIDVITRLRTTNKKIEEVLDRIFQTTNGQSQEEFDEKDLQDAINEKKSRKFISVNSYVRLARVAESEEPAIEVPQDELRRSAIYQYSFYGAILKRENGILYGKSVRLLKGKKWMYGSHGLLMVNQVIKKLQFDPQNPLKMVKDAAVRGFVTLWANHRPKAHVSIRGKMGEFWTKTIQRIKLMPTKKLLSIPDLQQCQEDMRYKRPDSPACYNAFKEINSISRAKLNFIVHKTAPIIYQRIPLVVYKCIRRRQGQYLIYSNMSTPKRSSRFSRSSLDVQLSPYDQRVVSIYLSVMKIINVYANAQLRISAKNSVVRTPLENVLSNAFENMYPARCEIISKVRRLDIRTFDKHDMRTYLPYPAKSGRVVLMQDLESRFMVAEQRTRDYKVTFIRLKNKKNRILVVTKRTRINDPYIMYDGKRKTLPFEIKGISGRVILRAYREKTPRSRVSITVELPLLGSKVRSHPFVYTEITLNAFYHSKVRGVCGDFDGELKDETKGPKCFSVYRWPRTFVSAHTTILASHPPLKQLEKLPTMTRFMDVRKCPAGRNYPTIR